MTSGITKELFGKTDDGKEVYKFAQVNKNGVVLETMSYGAIILGIKCPDKNGRFDDITLGFDDFEGYYRRNGNYFGCMVGRVCNRIAFGKFELDGNTFQVPINNPPSCNHGGKRGFDQYLWDYRVNEDSVTFSRTSADGEEGFPGNVEIQVTYSLSDADEVKYSVKATSDKPTPINITNHSNFNLAGQVDADIFKHVAYIDADFYLPTDEFQLPTGKLIPTKDDPVFDFREPKEFGRDIDKTPEKGYDHCFCLNEGNISKLAARVTEPNTGRFLKVYTTQPGIQLYTANFLDGQLVGKNGIAYKKYGGFCLETQNYPDAINRTNFPNSVLRPGETYQQSTIIKLGVVHN